MTTSTRTRAAALCALLASTSLAAPALGQSLSPYPAERSAVDDNGVDLVGGKFNFSLTAATIGSGRQALSVTHYWGEAGLRDNYSGDLRMVSDGGLTKIVITFGGRSETFVYSGSSWAPKSGSGATLTGSNEDYLYTAADGTRIQFQSPVMQGLGDTNRVEGPYEQCSDLNSIECAVPIKVTTPDGLVTDLAWGQTDHCDPGDGTLTGQTCTAYYRLTEVSNNAGYALKLAYMSDATENGIPLEDWYTRAKAELLNTSTGGPGPIVTYGRPANGVMTIADPAGRQWRFAGGLLTAVRRPGSAADNISIAYDGSGAVASVTADGVTTNYARSVSGSEATTTITNALSQQSVVKADLAKGRITSVTDPLNRTTSFQYDPNGRLTHTVLPEGNELRLIYDARGNVTERRQVARPGTGLPDIVTSTSYDATCANPVTCNRPGSTTDARGHVTDYAYDPAHGGLTSVTAPAPTSGAVRPQTRYGYSLVNGIYELSSVSACQTQASCAGTADEVKTVIGYGANNLPASISSGSGDGSLSATSAMGYDEVGNLITVDGPLAGSADTIRNRYDAARQLIGAVSPDPDGAGVLKHRAVRTTYRPDGQVERQERGTVSSQSDADWATFSSLEAVETGYDGNARPVTTRLVAGGAVHSLGQLSYDALGRPECQAVRMNPAAFGSLPASACSLGAQGSFGPDRITRSVYDAAGQVTQVRSAVGTAEEAAEVTATYTPNGLVWMVTDGENNQTAYGYDGHDRLMVAAFPNPAKGSGAYNYADREDYGYDPAGNLTSLRTRAGEVIGFSAS